VLAAIQVAVEALGVECGYVCGCDRTVMDSRSHRQRVQHRTLCVTTLIRTLCGSVWLRALALLASVQAQAAAREREAYAVGAAGHLFAGAYGASGSRFDRVVVVHRAVGLALSALPAGPCLFKVVHLPPLVRCVATLANALSALIAQISAP
jgi:hypothetical protein